MKLSPVNNVAFGNIYAVHGKQDRMKKFEAVMSSAPEKTDIAYIDATDVYPGMVYRTTRDVNLQRYIRKGESVGYLFTGEDVIARKAIRKLNDYAVSNLNLHVDGEIDMNKDSIPNIF